MAIQDHQQYTRLMNFVSNLITKIPIKQAAYMTAHGKYFQGLTIPATNCGGITDVAIDSSIHPYDQAESWGDFDSITFTTNTKIPINITVNVYKSPGAIWGWVVIVELRHTGLDPDEYGNTGDHWIYKHQEGLGFPDGIWDNWYVMDDTVNGSV